MYEPGPGTATVLRESASSAWGKRCAVEPKIELVLREAPERVSQEFCDLTS